MNNDAFNMNVRKFLKSVGVRSQHEIEQAVTLAIASGKLKGNESLKAKMVLTVSGIDINVSFDDEIKLE